MFKDIADSRSRLLNAKSPDETIAAANAQTNALGRLLVVVENYPNLKANEQFNGLMDELSGTENRIATERMRYNESVQEYNTSRRQFPGNLTAKMFAFKDYPFFEAPPAATQVPKVNFSKPSEFRGWNIRWERRLWKGRRYVLTDFRLIATDLGDEISLDDIGDIHRSQASLQRCSACRRSTSGTGTRDGAASCSGTSAAAPSSRRSIELLATDRQARADTDAAGAARATMTWEPRIRTAGAREALTAIAVVLVALVAVVVGLHGKSPRHRLSGRRCDLSERREDATGRRSSGSWSGR